MSQILVRRLPEEVVERLKTRAKENGRSLESEARTILTDASQPVPASDEEAAKLAKRERILASGFRISNVSREEALRHLKEIQEELKGRKFPDSVELIREDRER